MSALAFGCDNTDETDAGMDDASMGDGGSDAGPMESCSDSVLNQDESDVDCGGTCGANCTPGDMCGGDGDCTTDMCSTGTCDALPSCSDGTMNGSETDVDCGGTMCGDCADGDMCGMNDDCTSSVCTSGTCAAPVCGDGATNGTEDCDDGAGGTPAESATCDIDCTDAECGDGVINATLMEPCDGDGAGAGGETATCNVDCTVSVCGDGVVNTTDGETCDGDGAGAGGETATCNTDCSAHMCGDGVLNRTAGEVCDDGDTDDTNSCPNSCSVAGLTITGTQVFDTDAGTLDGTAVPGWDGTAYLLTVASLDIPSGATLTVVGSQPFQVITTGDITVAGTLDVSGAAGTDGPSCDAPGTAGGLGGPGGSNGGNGGGFGDVGVGGLDGDMGSGAGGGGGGVADNAGGGGGGHRSAGTAGAIPTGGSGTGGAAGVAYGTALTFEGGSGGGGGSVDDDTPTGFDTGDDGGGGGGGGGGAGYLDALANLTVTGTILATGGDGGEDGCDAGAGGGGSGGWIRLIAAAAVPVVSAATIDVSGGTGGSSSGVDAVGGDGAEGRWEYGMMPLCMDGVMNQDETDVDCGGSLCGACTAGGACLIDGDCSSATVCLRNFCQAATCDNTTMDGTETDVDCGGADCAACADGLMCSADTDCGGTCDTTTSLCISCGDSAMNQDETDVDCGGALCAACGDGLMCAADTDCVGVGTCDTTASTCSSCGDSAMNQDETDVDCGGAICGACASGSMCSIAADCLSGICTASACVPIVFTEDFEGGPPLATDFVVSGDADWFVSTTPPIAGTYSARSGSIGNSELSNLDLDVTCIEDGTLTFTYQVSSEDGWDYLLITIDGSEPSGSGWSGVDGPTTVNYPITAGTHTVRWQYDKDSSDTGAVGSDTGWIDDISITGCMPTP